MFRVISLTLFLLLNTGCGGDSSSESSATITEPTIPENPPIVIDPYEAKLQAARLLNQATFGATLSDIEKLIELGDEVWIEEQFNLPASYHLPLVEPFIDNEDF